MKDEGGRMKFGGGLQHGPGPSAAAGCLYVAVRHGRNRPIGEETLRLAGLAQGDVRRQR